MDEKFNPRPPLADREIVGITLTSLLLGVKVRPLNSVNFGIVSNGDAMPLEVWFTVL